VRLVGGVADVPHFLRRLDVAVLCSQSEGLSNALLEYMAAGRAIVSTRVGACARLIDDGVQGLLIPPGQVEPLVAALDRLLREPHFARQLALAARQRAEVEFSRAAMRRRFEDFYHELAAA
jgi:glycosyltransferase involved in cell wall biosynthesis